jgi:hypothetical protein
LHKYAKRVITEITAGKRAAGSIGAGGRILSGTVVHWQPSRQFAGTAEAWHDGLLVELYDSNHGPLSR